MQTSSTKRAKSNGVRSAAAGMVTRGASWMAAQCVSYGLIFVTVYLIAQWRLG